MERVAAVREGKNNGAALPLPLHSSESFSGNTPVP